VYDFSSGAGTTTPVLDEGVDNEMFPENYLSRYATMSANGGMSDQTIPTGVWTMVRFDKKQDEYDEVNSRLLNLGFDAIEIDSEGDSEGQYSVTASVYIDLVADTHCELALYINGADSFWGTSFVTSKTGSFKILVNGEGYLIAGDLVQLYVKHDAVGNAIVHSNGRTKLHAVKHNSRINTPFNRAP